MTWVTSSLQLRVVERIPEIRVRLMARARRTLYWSSVMRWSALRGKTRLCLIDCLDPSRSGSRGFLALYSRLILEAGIVETDCFTMSQHSTAFAGLVTALSPALDAPVVFARALRFPIRLLIPITDPFKPKYCHDYNFEFKRRCYQMPLTICPCVEPGLSLPTRRSICSPSPVILLALRLCVVSSVMLPNIKRRQGTYFSQLWHTCQSDAWYWRECRLIVTHHVACGTVGVEARDTMILAIKYIKTGTKGYYYMQPAQKDDPDARRNGGIQIPSAPRLGRGIGDRKMPSNNWPPLHG